MKKLSIKNIIEFRSKSERSQQNFVNEIKLNTEKTKTEGGGDYWISSLSALSNSYKSNDLQLIKDKIYVLEDKFEDSEYKRTKTMYQRNIDILYNYENYDFNKWRPAKKLTFIKKHNFNSALTIKGLQIKATPHHVFSFPTDHGKEIGAIWFVAKLNGLKKDELGMFTDLLFRYLKINFSKGYNLNPLYCIAVDVVNNFDVNYSQIQDNEITQILNSTIDQIKKLL